MESGMLPISEVIEARSKLAAAKLARASGCVSRSDWS